MTTEDVSSPIRDGDTMKCPKCGAWADRIWVDTQGACSVCYNATTYNGKVSRKDERKADEAE